MFVAVAVLVSLAGLAAGDTTTRTCTTINDSAEDTGFNASQGLLAYWSFEGDDPIADDTGNTNPSLVGSVPGQTGGVFNTSGFRIGDDGYIRVPDDPALKPRDGLTISLWATIPQLTDDFQAFVDKNFSKQWYLGTAHPGRTGALFRWHVRLDGQEDFSWTDQYEFELDRWYHLAMTYDAGTGNWSRYVDGDLVGSEELSCSGDGCRLGTSTTPLCIGYSCGFERNKLNGTLDEVRIYGKALSSNAVDALSRGAYETCSVTEDTSTNETGSNETDDGSGSDGTDDTTDNETSDTDDGADNTTTDDGSDGSVFDGSNESDTSTNTTFNTGAGDGSNGSTTDTNGSTVSQNESTNGTTVDDEDDDTGGGGGDAMYPGDQVSVTPSSLQFEAVPGERVERRLTVRNEGPVSQAVSAEADGGIVSIGRYADRVAAEGTTSIPVGVRVPEEYVGDRYTTDVLVRAAGRQWTVPVTVMVLEGSDTGGSSAQGLQVSSEVRQVEDEGNVSVVAYVSMETGSSRQETVGVTAYLIDGDGRVVSMREQHVRVTGSRTIPVEFESVADGEYSVEVSARSAGEMTSSFSAVSVGQGSEETADDGASTPVLPVIVLAVLLAITAVVFWFDIAGLRERVRHHMRGRV